MSVISRMNYRHVSVVHPFPDDISEANMKLVFMEIVKEILDSSGIFKPVASGMTQIDFLDAGRRPWLVDADEPSLSVKNSDIFDRRFDLLKRSFDLRTTYICHERGISDLRRAEGIAKAGLPMPSFIAVSCPVTLVREQEIDFILKPIPEGRTGKAKIVWETNSDDSFEPVAVEISGKRYRVFYSDSKDRLEAMLRGKL